MCSHSVRPAAPAALAAAIPRRAQSRSSQHRSSLHVKVIHLLMLPMCELVLRIYLKMELCSLLLGSNFNFNSGFFLGVNSECRLNALKSYAVRLNFDLTQ